MADPFVLVPVADPTIGMVIGSFVITQLLGRGGMGAVYLAQHKAAAHIRCVYKTILAHLSNNALMISRFNTETEAVGRLRHENIVELKDFGVLPNGQMFMQFEFIAGTPLDHFLAEWGGRLSLHRAMYLAFQVCDALDHAHAAGVVHRDLKPDNLLVVIQDDKRVPRLVKIVDFGIAKVVRPGEVLTISGMKMGTPYYMSVEQYANAAEATAKSDVFSLAVILWQMITGDLPWGRSPEPGVLYHLQRTVVPTLPPEDVMPAAVARILLRCFSVDPDDRPTMRQLALDLAAVVPATDDAPSGGAILMHIARRFLTSSPEHARTMPRSAIANPDGVAAQIWPPANTAASPRASPDPVALPGALPSASAPSPESPPFTSDADGNGTAQASRPVLGVPAALSCPAPTTPLRSPGDAVSDPVAAQVPRNPPTPVLAALPTGLLSQRFVVQEPPADVREPSITVASEIELAAGALGPQPYAHAELPAVLVSSTQLSGLTPNSGTPAAPLPGPPEPPPFVVLPGASRSTARRRVIALGTAACTLATVVSYVIAHERSQANLSPVSHEVRRTDDGSAGSEPTTERVPTASAAIPGGPINGRSPLAVAVPDRQLAAGAGVHPSLHSANGPGAEDTTESRPSVASRATDGGAADRTRSSPDTGIPDTGIPTDSIRATDVSAANAHATVAAVDLAHPSLPRDGSRQVQKTPQAQVAPVKKTGELAVLVRPWALLWLNGKPMNQTPYRETVPAGRYYLRLQNDDLGKDESIAVTVNPDQTTIVERKW